VIIGNLINTSAEETAELGEISAAVSKKTMLPAQILDRHAGFRLLQIANDLLFREPLLHVRFSLQKRTLLTSDWY